MIDVDALIGVFCELHGAIPRVFHAPGRVNLIGEHTDYNEGFVLPIAIDKGTAVAAVGRDDRRVTVFSRNLDERGEIDLDGLAVRKRGVWLDYVEGMARVLESRGVRLRGADLVIESDVPTGAGLSSSAALEMASGLALLAVSGRDVARRELALAGQEAEHEYVGTNCGVMDQFISSLGRPGSALLIDCRSLHTEPIRMAFDGTAVVVCDSRVKHNHASSEYNARRAECEQGVGLLRPGLAGARALRDVSPGALDRHRSLLPETVYRRCHHVVTENERTLDAAEALRAGDVARMGRLMSESHASLRFDYEVSCVELDALVDIASSIEGVTGSRMTGGGFGGCTVSLVASDRVDAFAEEISRRYAEATGLEPFVYPVVASEGARELVRTED